VWGVLEFEYPLLSVSINGLFSSLKGDLEGLTELLSAL
jgi:hypothetical protein